MADKARTVTQDTVAEMASGAAAKLKPVTDEAIDQVADRIKSGDVQGMARDAAGIASNLKGAALDGGRQFLDDARERATGFADQRKDDAARSVADLASSLRETGKGFEERPNIKAFVGSAADGLDQLASGLRERSFGEIYADVEDYARRSPATVGLIAVAAGFALARFIKSSADELSEAGEKARRRSSPRRPASAGDRA